MKAKIKGDQILKDESELVIYLTKILSYKHKTIVLSQFYY